MNEQDWQRAVRAHRPHLQAVAYRMLGSVSEADDAVQEAWLRLEPRRHATRVDNLGGWLTTVVGRVCLDMLRVAPRAARGLRRQLAARADRQPRRGDESRARGAARRLRRPRAARRARDADAGRAARVRPARHVRRAVRRDRRDRRPQPGRRAPAREPRPPARARRAAERRRRPGAAARGRRRVPRRVAGGDFEALVAVLDPDVVFRVDTGRGQPRWRGRRSRARSAVARRAARAGPTVRAVSHGRRSSTAPPGWSSRRRGRPIAVVGFTIAGGRIAAIDLITDREKLDGLVIDA